MTKCENTSNKSIIEQVRILYCDYHEILEHVSRIISQLDININYNNKIIAEIDNKYSDLRILFSFQKCCLIQHHLQNIPDLKSGPFYINCRFSDQNQTYCVFDMTYEYFYGKSFVYK